MRPRRWAGEISAMYMGETPDAGQIAQPPTILHTHEDNEVISEASLPSGWIAKTSAASVSSFFRPKRLLSPPRSDGAYQAANQRAAHSPSCAGLD